MHWQLTGAGGSAANASYSTQTCPAHLCSSSAGRGFSALSTSARGFGLEFLSPEVRRTTVLPACGEQELYELVTLRSKPQGSSEQANPEGRSLGRCEHDGLCLSFAITGFFSLFIHLLSLHECKHAHAVACV